MNILQKTLNNPRVRSYLIVGVSVYVLELLIIVAAQALGAGSVAAVGLAFWIGLIISFGLQKLVTFGDKRLHHKVVLRQIVLTGLLVLFNFGFTILVTKLLSSIVPAVICRTLALGITTIWNFYLYKTHIFTPAAKKKRKSRRSGLLKPLQRYHKQTLRRYHRWHNKPAVKRLRKLADRARFGRLYLFVCLAALLATTLLWAWLGARLQQGNADQLVNAYLFDSSAVLHGAAMPDQHSFLVKWPLFYLVKVLGYSAGSFMTATILCAVATVAGFAYLLSRIERRPLALGTLFLLLACVLLLVPAQPYAGGLLPVNMAMLTTRNLEYILYIASLVCLAKTIRLRSWPFAAATALLALLVVSDKLFLSVSVGGALLAMVGYALRQNWQLVTLAVRWLMASLFAGTGAIVAALLINQSHLTHLVGKSIAGPYGAAQGAHTMGLGIFYGIGGLLTNFGANPAYDALTIRQIPHSLAGHLFSFGGPAYVVNGLFAMAVIVAAVVFVLRSLQKSREDQVVPPPTKKLASMLVWASIAVFGLFVVSNHDYQVDARYLALLTFAGFVIAANWLRPRRLDAVLVALAAPVLFVVLLCGSVAAVQTYHTQKLAYSSLDYRNARIAQALRGHHVDVLAGDYWRVLPIKSLTDKQSQTVLPLSGCVEPRGILTSRAWQPDLQHHSAAYLLTFDASLTDYPHCTLVQIIKAYGLPNNSTLIDGSLAHPKELLLFYDQGVHASPPEPAGQTPPTVLPIPLADVPHTICTVPTIMNIVAHQDDDLLFLSPDLLHDLAAGNCMRSIYLTAGDAGGDQQYWLSREQGSEAAYSSMLGSSSTLWIHRVVALPGGQFATIASPKGNDRISLVFMHLPDGNVDGDGFRASHHQSIAELESGKISSLRTVDEQSAYTSGQLTEALIDLMHAYQPAEIRTQSNYRGQAYVDHSDHMATGRFAAQAHAQYEVRQYAGYVQVPLRFYMGYPVHELEPNLSPEDLALKQAAFMAYAHFDGSVCRRAAEPCRESDVYEAYLAREYQNPF